jgi:23S rRNA (cytosine1962-C5)-methyltransferase
LEIPVIYRDDNLLVVNKPVGVNTHSDGEAGGADVVTALKRTLNLTYIGVHHRLDREVSGVLAFAVRKEANAALAQAFEGRLAVKEYVALVRGKLPQRAGTVEAPLIEEKSGVWRVARKDERGAKPALTRYRVEIATETYTLVRLTLETGRTHQLRVHLAHLGCPIIGDPIYSQPLKSRSQTAHPAKAAPGDFFPRLLLHAARLVLPQPGKNEKLELLAPLPPIFARAASGQPLPEVELAARLGNSSLSIGKISNRDRDGLTGLLNLANERRAPLSNDPDRTTTAYRLVNGTGDGLPGVTLDKYGDALVLNSYDLQLEPGAPALQILLDAISVIWQKMSVYGKFRPRQASTLSSARPEEVAPEKPLVGVHLPELTVVENGLNYLIRPGDGLSPGLFLDMRDGRASVAELAAGKTLLNTFSFTCAFGLVAAKTGAKRALNLDAGRRVLDWGKQNYALNALTPDDYDFVEGDVFDWLVRFGRRGQTFDIIILDPPSYSTVKKTRWSVERNYGELALLATKVTAPGGYLLACTNHAGLSRRNFRQDVLQGVAHAGRSAQVLAYLHEPDLDFPRPAATEPYLKALLLMLD